MPADRIGSGSYQSLAPLPASDRFQPPLASRTGDRPFLPPAGYAPPVGFGHRPDQPPQEPSEVRDEDSEPTNPLPVILPGALPGQLPGDPPAPLPLNLPGAASIPRPAQIEAPRGPFEPARPARQTSITGSVAPPPPTNGDRGAAGSFRNAAPGELAVPPGHSIPEAASAKLEQIKDLYLTAEAIGEDALDKHFDQVSQRQRELIKEFFQRSHPEDSDPQ
jgi:hypothetical protein